MQARKKLRWFAGSAALVCLALFGTALRADVESGPTLKEAPPALKLKCLAGPNEGNEIDFTESRAKQPTVYFFVRADRFTRPMAQVLRQIDSKIVDVKDGASVAVWLTSDVDKTKNYLPVVQKAIKLDRTSLALHPSVDMGPDKWGINSDADLTVVVVRDGKVHARFGFVGPNANVAEQILKEFKD